MLLRRCLLLLLLFASTVAAQVPTGMVQPPTMDENTPVSTALLQQWLHSGDPRLVAWAADFARRTHDRTVLQEIPAVLDGWMWPAPNNFATGMPQRWAAMAMLDALIQENVAVPLRTIEAAADEMPSQALILTARLPPSESQRKLSDWAGGSRSGLQPELMARVAVMLLANDPRGVRILQAGMHRSLVGFVTAAAEEELVVTLLPPGASSNRGGSGGAGSMVTGSMPLGWPIVYGYGLDETIRSDDRPTLASLGNDRVVWVRYANSGSGSWSSVEPLDASTRHRLLAWWLGVPAKEMTWQPQVFEDVYWTSRAAYLAQLGALVDAERGKQRETVSLLQRKQLLTDAEAAEVMPALKVTVHCEIRPCPID